MTGIVAEQFFYQYYTFRQCRIFKNDLDTSIFSHFLKIHGFHKFHVITVQKVHTNHLHEVDMKNCLQKNVHRGEIYDKFIPHIFHPTWVRCPSG